jgi:hypothetical protein
MAFSLSSPAFEPEGQIPRRHSCEGEDTSPPLSWSDLPDGTRSLALICDDPDAPSGTFVHWLAWGIDPGGGGLGEGEAAPLEPYDGVPVDAVRDALQAYEPILRDGDDVPGGALLDACREAADLPQALAAVDLALWDRAGNREGRPVSALITDEPAESVRVNATIAAVDRAGAAAAAAEAARAGYSCVKVKVGLGDDAGRRVEERPGEMRHHQAAGAERGVEGALRGELRQQYRAAHGVAAHHDDRAVRQPNGAGGDGAGAREDRARLAADAERRIGRPRRCVALEHQSVVERRGPEHPSVARERDRVGGEGHVAGTPESGHDAAIAGRPEREVEVTRGGAGRGRERGERDGERHQRVGKNEPRGEARQSSPP